MLTISSIGGGPRPLQTTVASPPPVAPGRVSGNTARDSAAAVVNVPSGDGTGVQSAALPSSLPPVTSPAEAANAGLPRNAPVLAPKESDGGTVRFKGELPPEPKGPVDQALDRQIEEYIPNLWKASRAAVDAFVARNEDRSADFAPTVLSETPLGTGRELPYAAGDASGKPPATPGSLLDLEV